MLNLSDFWVVNEFQLRLRILSVLFSFKKQVNSNSWIGLSWFQLRSSSNRKGDYDSIDWISGKFVSENCICTRLSRFRWQPCPSLRTNLLTTLGLVLQETSRSSSRLRGYSRESKPSSACSLSSKNSLCLITIAFKLVSFTMPLKSDASYPSLMPFWQSWMEWMISGNTWIASANDWTTPWFKV